MIHPIIGLIIMSIGVIIMCIGVYGIYKFKDFYSRATVASVIDTAGFILVAGGIIIYSGFTLFSLKIVVIIFFMLLLNPLSNHVIARGAYVSGHSITPQTVYKEESDD